MSPRTDRQAHGLIVDEGLARINTQRQAARAFAGPCTPRRRRTLAQRAARLGRQLLAWLLAPSPFIGPRPHSRRGRP